MDCKEILFSPGLTVLHGENGSGKSSIVEALYYLSRGRSFRTSDANALIPHMSNRLILRTDIVHNNLEHHCAIVRHNGKTVTKVNGRLSPLSHIAKLSPTLFADSDTYRSFMAFPAYRRRVFDWLGFHVKPGYLEAARKYSSVLKNRNAALKACMDTSPWDGLLATEAETLTSLRQELFNEFLPFFNTAGSDFLEQSHWVFDPGYDEKEGYASALSENHDKDRQIRRTSCGPHSADWLYIVGNKRTKDLLSQGQQKTAFFHIIAAQDRFMQSAGVTPMLLIDDYSAELDTHNRLLLQSLVFERAGQSVITCIHEPSEQAIKHGQVFHVKRGGLQPLD